MYVKTKLVRFSLVIAIGRWKSDIRKLVKFANAVMTVSNTFFLVPFLHVLLRATNSL